MSDKKGTGGISSSREMTQANIAGAIEHQLAMMGFSTDTLGEMKSLRKQIASSETAVKVLATRCAALASEIEALKKSGASAADIAMLKKEIAALKKK